MKQDKKEEDAAVKIQAIQRGNADRKEVTGLHRGTATSPNLGSRGLVNLCQVLISSNFCLVTFL